VEECIHLKGNGSDREINTQRSSDESHREGCDRGKGDEKISGRIECSPNKNTFLIIIYSKIKVSKLREEGEFFQPPILFDIFVNFVALRG